METLALVITTVIAVYGAMLATINAFILIEPLVIHAQMSGQYVTRRCPRGEGDDAAITVPQRTCVTRRGDGSRVEREER